MIKFTGILPYSIKYVTSIKEGFAGITSGIFISIRYEHRNDLGLHAHELVHVKQFYRTLGLHSIFYRIFKWYRLRTEIEAYKAQLEYCVGNYDWLYEKLMNNYDLDVTIEELKQLI